MNERLKQFVDQCRGDPMTSAFEPRFDKEKFAELIVKETMQVVANNLPQNTYLDVVDAVIEHFKE